MKNNIQFFIVYLSVKYSPVFLMLSTTSIMLSVLNRIPSNNFSLILMFSVILFILSTCYFNTRNDYFYTKTMKLLGVRHEDYDTLLYFRGKSLWMSVFIGSIFLLFFSFMSFNHCLTTRGIKTYMNGKPVENFTLVNTFRINNYQIKSR